MTMKAPSGFNPEAWQRVGGLSNPSKLPGYAYSLPAKACLMGAVLHKKSGSVCEKCYALKGRYNFPNVQKAMQRRLKAIDEPGWVVDMSLLINQAAAKGHVFFRWHDSGDLQSLGHLCRIIYIAQRCPSVHFWLPTREVQIVGSLKIPVPSNLVIRESCHFIDEYYPSKNKMPTSTVKSKKGHPTSIPTTSYFCPAYTQGGKCGDCRVCWDPTVKNVCYPQH